MLDTSTLLVVALFSHTLSTVVIYMNWRVSPSVPGVREWAIGRSLVSVSLIVFLFQAKLPLALSVPLGNGLMHVGFYTVWLGSRRFLNAPPANHVLYGTGIAISILFLVYFSTIVDEPETRKFISSIFVVIYSVFYVNLILRYNNGRFVTARMFMISVGIHGAAHAVLVAGFPFSDPGSSILNTHTFFQIYLFEGVLISIFSGCLYIAMTAEYLNRNLKLQASIDPLTQTMNRRAFHPLAESAVEGQKRQGGTVSMMMIDVDHFKAVNDDHGHLVGDEALRQISAVLHQCVRANDIVCRYGGEEFVALLPGAGLDDARQIAERIRATVQSLKITGRSSPFSVTVSIGLSAFSENCNLEDLEELIAAADLALYEAKTKGRNRIESTPAKPAEPSFAFAYPLS